MAALLYTAFVIYGSLVPLEYQALPLDEALARFRRIRFLELGIGSRADWAANLLLFIPLAFLWTGVLAHRRRLPVLSIVSLMVAACAALLSLGIEFVQVYFPQRTVSLNDLFAETLGGVLGVVCWWLFGTRFIRWLAGWKSAKGHIEIAQRLAVAYLAMLFAYSLLPLDLTLSPVEVYHKFREGKLNLIPFARLPHGFMPAIYELASDGLLWFVPALLWRWPGKTSAMRVWIVMMGAAMLLEILQLFVYSRVSDITDLFTAAVGTALGIQAAGLINKNVHASSESGHSGFPVLTLMLAMGWVGVIFIVFWYPFDFRTDGAFLRGRLHDFLTRAPFEAYYFGTEYRAATEVLHKVLFFIPLGVALGWLVSGLRYMWRGHATLISMVAMAGIAGIAVAGRLAQPGKNPDIMDLVLQWLGGVIGFVLIWKMRQKARYMSAKEDEAQSASTPRAMSDGTPATIHPRWPASAAWTIGMMALGLWAVMSLPFVPYNVRELFRQDMPWLSALLVSINCYWLASWPVWLARRRVSGVVRLLQLPLGLLLYGLIDFVILYFAVPEESLHDLVGSPVLGWAWQWETLGRWIALASLPGVTIYLAAQSVRSLRGLKLGILHFAAVLPVIPLAYWVVVEAAATDNLVELIAAPRALAYIALCGWLYVLMLAAALAASPLQGKQAKLRFLGILVSLPLAALLLNLGLADGIEKYGQRFSAIQFLLSADRQHYVSPPVVWLRYSVLHFLAIAAIAFIQWPFFRARPRPNNQITHADH
jgi:glycopeptide antibiotics resistance protein